MSDMRYESLAMVALTKSVADLKVYDGLFALKEASTDPNVIKVIEHLMTQLFESNQTLLNAIDLET